MTLSLAWLRNTGDVQELVFASDSRLTGGYYWDACPKILPLPRQDCALCFAGDTGFAYPVMLQLAAAVRSNPRMLNRALDLSTFKGKALQIINGMREHIHSAVAAVDAAGQDKTFLLLAGYSWREANFKIWTLHFDASLDAFTFRPANPWDGVDAMRVLASAGDSLDEFKSRLIALLAARGKRSSGGFDMEPFEVLRDMIRAQVNASIGGPPQLAKIYRHLNATPVPVWWPQRTGGRIALLGRTLLDYEVPFAGVLDPDTLKVE